MRMNNGGFDFSTPVDIPAHRHYHNTPWVQLSAKGLLSINSGLRRQLGEQRQFRAKLSPDGRFLALCTGEEPNVCFSRKHGRAF